MEPRWDMETWLTYCSIRVQQSHVNLLLKFIHCVPLIWVESWRSLCECATIVQWKWKLWSWMTFPSISVTPCSVRYYGVDFGLHPPNTPREYVIRESSFIDACSEYIFHASVRMFLPSLTFFQAYPVSWVLQCSSNCSPAKKLSTIFLLPSFI